MIDQSELNRLKNICEAAKANEYNLDFCTSVECDASTEYRELWHEANKFMLPLLVEIERWKKEAGDLRKLFDELTKRTLPGEFDSGDALRKYIEGLKMEVLLSGPLYSRRQLEAKLAIAKEALKHIIDNAYDPFGEAAKISRECLEKLK
jgi:hypothetical protein